MTAAYKKKLEEDKKWLAEEKVREAQEQKNDVVMKGHMGDFYRFVCVCFRFDLVLHGKLWVGWGCNIRSRHSTGYIRQPAAGALTVQPQCKAVLDVHSSGCRLCALSCIAFLYCMCLCWPQVV